MTTPQTCAAAAEAGLTKYHGNPCKHGHTERYTINGACVACQSQWLVRQRNSMRKQIIQSKGAK